MVSAAEDTRGCHQESMWFLRSAWTLFLADWAQFDKDMTDNINFLVRQQLQERTANDIRECKWDYNISSFVSGTSDVQNCWKSNRLQTSNVPKNENPAWNRFLWNHTQDQGSAQVETHRHKLHLTHKHIQPLFVHLNACLNRSKCGNNDSCVRCSDIYLWQCVSEQGEGRSCPLAPFLTQFI